MISGTVYGVALNDRNEYARLAGQFTAPPYLKPPVAPVLYIKPRNTLTFGSAAVQVPASLPAVDAAATLGLLFSRDATAVNPDDAVGRVGAVCLALDIGAPQASYYRPATYYRNRDGFLPLGAFADAPADYPVCDIATFINHEKKHSWQLARLLRPVAQLIADISAFMTLKAGDLLLVGLPGDAPRAVRGDVVELRSAGLPSLRTMIIPELNE